MIRRKFHIPWGYCLAIAMVVLIFCVAFIQFDNESENNTRSVTSIITNAEYDDDKAKAWARFEINWVSLYYQFYDRANAKDDFKTFETLANDKVVVTVAVTDEKDFLRMFFDFIGIERIKRRNLRMDKIMEINPIDKATALLATLKEYSPTIRRKSDKGYDWLEEETDVCIEVLNPGSDNPDDGLTIICEDEYKQMCQMALDILNNKVCSAELLCGEDKSWLGSCFMRRDKMERPVREVFAYLLSQEYFAEKIQSSGYEVHYRFWDKSLNKNVKVCDECGSEYLASSSKMLSLCPECAHVLYGYENCKHEFKDGKCTLCLWDGSKSEYIESLRKKDTV